ncbi:helix-turn-helix domain-containing protein [Bordetella genomosp. 13]|uniref:helix-turn-helix domain-containing protein n=1 Tax=Bordetella genomosp. 13 TaxID=463040 RepID=UPI0011A4E15A|nr:helix-turn-helix domain-containing protein [Bordetella genomosp. 13]
MNESLVTVEQAAEHLGLHPKTVLRYIRDRRLPATRVGKSYRIVRSELDAFAGVASVESEAAAAIVRTTCIVDIPRISADEASRLATFLQSIALARPACTAPLHLQTAFDPLARSMKVVVIGDPSSAARLLEALPLHMGNRS